MPAGDSSPDRRPPTADPIGELFEPFARLAGMDFLRSCTPRDRRDLILNRAEAWRLRRLEEARIREAQRMIAEFFGLPTPEERNDRA
jgi:hypothetical protein